MKGLVRMQAFTFYVSTENRPNLRIMPVMEDVPAGEEKADE
jgi:hypothetical protein